MTTPCAGQWVLFDATDPESHREARALCATCPQMLACAITAKELSDKEGTWAGKLYGDIGPLRRVREDAAWTDMEAQVAHYNFNKGARDERTREGNRVYERRKVARRRAAQRASGAA